MNRSPPLSLSAVDLRKVLTGLLIAILGAVLTVLENEIPGVEWGVYWGVDITPFVVAFNSVLVNLARKFLFRGSPEVATKKAA